MDPSTFNSVLEHPPDSNRTKKSGSNQSKKVDKKLVINLKSKKAKENSSNCIGGKGSSSFVEMDIVQFQSEVNKLRADSQEEHVTDKVNEVLGGTNHEQVTLDAQMLGKGEAMETMVTASQPTPGNVHPQLETQQVCSTNLVASIHATREGAPNLDQLMEVEGEPISCDSQSEDDSWEDDQNGCMFTIPELSMLNREPASGSQMEKTPTLEERSTHYWTHQMVNQGMAGNSNNEAGANETGAINNNSRGPDMGRTNQGGGITHQRLNAWDINRTGRLTFAEQIKANNDSEDKAGIYPPTGSTRRGYKGDDFPGRSAVLSQELCLAPLWVFLLLVAHTTVAAGITASRRNRRRIPATAADCCSKLVLLLIRVSSTASAVIQGFGLETLGFIGLEFVSMFSLTHNQLKKEEPGYVNIQHSGEDLSAGDHQDEIEMFDGCGSWLICLSRNLDVVQTMDKTWRKWNQGVQDPQQGGQRNEELMGSKNGAPLPNTSSEPRIQRKMGELHSRYVSKSNEPASLTQIAQPINHTNPQPTQHHHNSHSQSKGKEKVTSETNLQIPTRNMFDLLDEEGRESEGSEGDTSFRNVKQQREEVRGTDGRQGKGKKKREQGYLPRRSTRRSRNRENDELMPVGSDPEEEIPDFDISNGEKRAIFNRLKEYKSVRAADQAKWVQVVLMNIIQQVVRLRLLGLSMRKTKAAIQVARIWGLQGIKWKQQGDATDNAVGRHEDSNGGVAWVVLAWGVFYIILRFGVWEDSAGNWRFHGWTSYWGIDWVGRWEKYPGWIKLGRKGLKWGWGVGAVFSQSYNGLAYVGSLLPLNLHTWHLRN
ncbi:hypothetical protein E3N88_10815 [Mikania micrantha]|uniref:Uncharacterized protein n=1 Tax=Mikania micrantha TaxID=192012 RepID=A0A5N6PDQ2_9ASTR|nr:hypothetical protein E3N88_10815 [Mikania micrantha]